MKIEHVISILSVISVIIGGIGECLKQFNKISENENAKIKK